MYHIAKEKEGYGIKGDGVHVRDLFFSKEETENFVDALNQFDVLPIHIFEIVEDYFGDFNF